MLSVDGRFPKDVDQILEDIDKFKETLLSPVDFDREYDLKPSLLAHLRRYQLAMRERASIDYSDFAPLVIQRFITDPAFMKQTLSKYEYVLIDEYQDVNPAQAALLDCFVEIGSNLWVVGDDDQAIYEFRGASPKFIIDFKSTYIGAALSVLHTNYRSAHSICQVANNLIGRSTRRVHKPNTSSSGDVGRVDIHRLESEVAEADFIASNISALVRSGKRPHEIAVLFRYNADSIPLQLELLCKRIPFQVRDEAMIWDRTAYRKPMLDAFFDAVSQCLPFYDAEPFPRAFQHASQAAFAKAPGQLLQEWRALSAALAKQALSSHSLADLKQTLMELIAFSRAEPGEQVALSTFHSAKGREWVTVFVAALDHQRASTDDERRAHYVALTRARSELTISMAASRYGDPTSTPRFLVEMLHPSQDTKTKRQLEPFSANTAVAIYSKVCCPECGLQLNLASSLESQRRSVGQVAHDCRITDERTCHLCPDNPALYCPSLSPLYREAAEWELTLLDPVTAHNSGSRTTVTILERFVRWLRS